MMVEVILESCQHAGGATGEKVSNLDDWKKFLVVYRFSLPATTMKRDDRDNFCQEGHGRWLEVIPDGIPDVEDGKTLKELKF